jgi:hypothetical protein
MFAKRRSSEDCLRLLAWPSVKDGDAIFKVNAETKAELAE